MADETSPSFDYRALLAHRRKEPMRFSAWIDSFMADPEGLLRTSAGLILDAIKSFGTEIIVRGGEPILRYKVFEDPFAKGLNAVYGQEICIKRIIDVIESVDKESGPKRGIVLVGPPASGKTNIVDLLALALEEYTKTREVRLYNFVWRLTNASGRELELRSALAPNPILLFPPSLTLADGSVARPRQELFDEIARRLRRNLSIPSYYQYATADKRTLDILAALMQNQRNQGKSLFDILEEYVRVEEITFSNAQGRGIANVDDMRQLETYVRPFTLAHEDVSLLNEHLQGKFMFKYEGAILNSNRGLLHIHDAFGSEAGRTPDHDYKPLLMLLGSGKITLEATQASVDTTVMMTTNLDEMEGLERQLTSSKLLDRIEKVPVNYLLDQVSEMDILRRDMAAVMEKYDVDPNLFRCASAYSVMTRLFAPNRKEFPKRWSDERKELYNRITPEQKLAIYACQSDDPVATIRRLPPWHPFRNECFRLGINIFNPEILGRHVVRHPDAIRLEDSGLFTASELALIDDEFMRQMREEHYPEEGKYGISVRQLQNIMRNTIASSDGIKVTVPLFIAQLEKLFQEGPAVHHWLLLNASKRKNRRIPSRKIGGTHFDDGEGNFDDYAALIKVVKACYYELIRREITVCAVGRDPERIEADLRRYLQHALLDKALENKAFSHILVPRYAYVDSQSGDKIERPDPEFMMSMERIIEPGNAPLNIRREIAKKFLLLQDRGDIRCSNNGPAIARKDDGLVTAFSVEYTRLLSHHRAVEGLSPEQIRDAFFHRSSDPEKYARCADKVRDFVETFINNMGARFGYSEEIALDTVIFALRRNIVDLSEVIR
ncbi:MAG: hypothetical protein RL095_2307 [Verrucomicrobiota bacterium]|jgi:predicted Ser/Thr protein kinase